MYKERQRILLKYIEKENLDGILISSNENIFYLTGAPLVRGSFCKILYLSKDGNAYLVVTALDYQETLDYAKEVEVVKAENGLLEEVKRFIGRRVGFEEKSMNYSMYQSLINSTELIPASNYLERMRERKDEKEVQLIMEAQKITEKALLEGLEKFSENMSEIELAAELEYFMRKFGAEGYAFDTIVASGYRSVYPHGSPIKKRIEVGENIIIDIGARLHGYCSNITRTVFFGKPKKDIVEIYEAVVNAQEAVIKAIKPGIEGKELDKIAREILREYGYDEYFIHGLGHGIGIDVHEAPFINRKCNRIVEIGNVITIEPGVYMPRVGGVRIEDLVLVTNGGCKNLTEFTKEFYEVG
ncbi:MAG: Xaa-Pro peptidase family protein [Candidatus Methanomethyliaceae archaeon]|nr:Xaa-Pro peptidase family protein [Candidatus Methanomethyliaceae archaeon]MDW7970888.1 Xaa-Pro peptidase family protein [Nitrososphaerota archaeon]